MSSADRSEVNSRSSHRTSQGLWLSITILRPWHLDFLLMSSSGGQPYHITKQNELQSNCDSHHQLGTPMFMHILPPTVLECVMVWPVTLGDKSAPLRLDVRFILFVNCHALILIFFFDWSLHPSLWCKFQPSVFLQICSDVSNSWWFLSPNSDQCF